MDIKKGLHKIGELCKMCGVTRKMILNFEEHGLIEAMSVDDESGYRYYGAPSAARICHIRALQKLGFSLTEIKKFISGDFDAATNHLDKLKSLRKEIDEQINRTEALLTQPGDYTVHKEFVPGGDYILKSKICEKTADSFWLLYGLTDYVFNKGWRVSDKGKSLISFVNSFSEGKFWGMRTAAWKMYEPNEETVHIEDTEALYINVKGPYTELEKAAHILKQYAIDNNYEINGDLMITYLTSPQSHANPDDYVSQVVLPIK